MRFVAILGLSLIMIGCGTSDTPSVKNARKAIEDNMSNWQLHSGKYEGPMSTSDPLAKPNLLKYDIISVTGDGDFYDAIVNVQLETRLDPTTRQLKYGIMHSKDGWMISCYTFLE